MTEVKVYKVEEVADLARVSVETVRRWLRSGKLKGTRMDAGSSGWRIPESEVQRILTGTDPGPAPTA